MVNRLRNVRVKCIATMKPPMEKAGPLGDLKKVGSLKGSSSNRDSTDTGTGESSVVEEVKPRKNHGRVSERT
jgi:hypothetical protein